MSLIIVDEKKCVRCGACAAVCPSQIIKMQESGFPGKGQNRSCIACGHCTSVCPVGALDNRKVPLSECMEFGEWKLPDSDNMAKILRSRRSVRCYKENAVTNEEITKVLDLARHAPTAGNAQGLSFLLYSDKKFLKEVSQAVIDWMQYQIDNKIEGYMYYRGAVKAWNEYGYDAVLRDAPNLVVAFAPKDYKMAATNCAYVWSYAELFAPTVGLGTCIAG